MKNMVGFILYNLLLISPFCLQPLLAHRLQNFPFLSRINKVSDIIMTQQFRGGSTIAPQQNDMDNDNDDNEDNDDDDEEEEEKIDITKHPDYEKLQKYLMQQQTLLQLRSTYLSEALTLRGFPMPTQTPEDSEKPKPIDWDCAKSTNDDPKSCMYSYDVEENRKVIAPINTDKWISIAALNNLRRDDPSKVESMWHNQYSILKSWFGTASEYSILQHVGIPGILLHTLLEGYNLQIVLAIIVFISAIIFMPIWEYMVNRFLVSSLCWQQWPNWAIVAHAALPFKVYLGQLCLNGIGFVFGLLVKAVRKQLIEFESEILEARIPLTVGPDSDIYELEEGEELDDDVDDDDDDALGNEDVGSWNDNNDEDDNDDDDDDDEGSDDE